MLSTSPGAFAEVPEHEASGAVKSVYEDIKHTLRVPVVSSVFRVLATNSDFLALAWRQLKPNMQTIYVEEQANDIRRQAVEGVASLGTAPSATERSPVVALKVQHYVNPKLLIAILALRNAVNGQYPKLGELPMSEKRQIESGIPEGAGVPWSTETPPNDKLQTIFDDMASSIGLAPANDDFAVFAGWSDYLEQAWPAFKSVIDRPEYRSLIRQFRWRAEESILVFPFRVEVNPHIMRLCGLSEHDIDAVRGTLDAYVRAFPRQVARTAFLAAGLLGTEAAKQSPFPTQPA